MQKLLKKLKEGNKLLMTHVVIGYPDLEKTEEVVIKMSRNGADIIEMQMPFSDPIADGETIMKASEIALKNKTTTKDCIELMAKLSKKIDTPLLLMGYFNTVFNYGTEKFCIDASRAGCQGLIIPDMPIEEEDYEHFYELCGKYNLAPIIVIAPNTDSIRLKKLSKFAKAFVYCIARKGTTGTKTEFDNDFEKYIKRVKSEIKLPIAVGFGISEKAQVDFVHKHAEIAVVGSAIIKNLENVEKFIKPLLSK